jgi:hypothetical protein
MMLAKGFLFVGQWVANATMQLAVKSKNGELMLHSVFD